jgi:hypothetical protein
MMHSRSITSSPRSAGVKEGGCQILHNHHRYSCERLLTVLGLGDLVVGRGEQPPTCSKSSADRRSNRARG